MLLFDHNERNKFNSTFAYCTWVYNCSFTIWGWTLGSSRLRSQILNCAFLNTAFDGLGFHNYKVLSCSLLLLPNCHNWKYLYSQWGVIVKHKYSWNHYASGQIGHTFIRILISYYDSSCSDMYHQQNKG